MRDALFYYLASKHAWHQWRALGDGFHVTKDNLKNITVPIEVTEKIKEYATMGRNLWSERVNYEGKKLNSGKINFYFKFIGSTEFYNY